MINYLFVTILLFFLGICGIFAVPQNIIIILISLVLMLLSINLNFILLILYPFKNFFYAYFLDHVF